MPTRSLSIALILLSCLISGSLAGAESLETLQAKYNAEVSRRKAQVEAAVFQRIVSKKGVFFDATDYYKSGFADQQYNLKMKEAEKLVNQLRADKKTGSIEYYQALNDFYTYQKMEYKELSANLEKKWYDSVSYWAVEGMKGSWNDAKLVAGEVWSKKWDLLKTLLDKGASEAIKSLIYETIDATYKVRFVDYAMKSHGATKKIAEYWWDHFIMGNFKKSKTMEIIEDVVGKGQEKLQEKLEEKVKERVKDELIKKGEELAKDELEKKTKEAAEGFIRNLVTVPSILIECAAKYYNVVDFNLMFLQAAPNEANYLNNEIRRVLKQLGKLNDDEINKCYFDSDYFMSLRKTVGGRKDPPKLTKQTPPENKDSKIKIKVKSWIEPEVTTAWEYVVLEDRVEEHEKKTVDNPPADFNVKPYLALVDAAVDELRADAIDYPAFKNKLMSITGKFNKALDAWGSAFAAKSSANGKRIDPKALETRKAGHRERFTRARDAQTAEIDKALKDYHAIIREAAEIEIQSELGALRESLNSKIRAFLDESEARSIALIGKNYLAPRKDSAYTSPGGTTIATASLWGLVENAAGVRRCFFTKAIENPMSTTGQYYQNSAAKGHIHNAVTVLMAGEWFSKSFYDIWYTGYNGSLKLKERVEEKWQGIEELLNPGKDLWRVYAANNKGETVLLKDVAAAVNSFRSKSKAADIKAIYDEYSSYTGLARHLLEKNEDATTIALAMFAIYEARLDARLSSHPKALKWVNTEGKKIADTNFADWKAITRSSVEGVAGLIANEIAPEDLEKEADRSIEERERIRATQKYVKEMANIEAGLRKELEAHKTSIYMQIEPMYKDYFGKYTVPERAVFTRLAEYPERIETALSDAVTTELSETRIAELYKKEPGYYMKDLVFDLRKCDVIYDKRDFFRLYVWGVGQGRFEDMKSLAQLHLKTEKAQDEVNKWAMAEYEALDKKITAGKDTIKTIEECQDLNLKLSQVFIDARQKFWDLVKPSERFVHLKYTDEVSKKFTEANNKLMEITRSISDNQ